MKKTNFLLGLSFVALLTFSACGPKDADVQKALTEAIAADDALNGFQVEVKDGVATIMGTTTDEAVAAKAEEVAKAIKGVKSVVNQVKVETPVVEQMVEEVVEIAEMSELEQGVKDAIKDLQGVEASVEDGIVTLTGEIKKTDLPKLMQMLSSLKPKKIDNNLTVN